VGDLAVFYEFFQSFEGRRISLQQSFSQPATLGRHLHERILLDFAAITSKQLKLGAAEVTVRQMTLNESEIPGAEE
jgi:hypothetical protein